MSLRFHNRRDPELMPSAGKPRSRRACLRWAAATLAVAALPSIVSADCPCGEEAAASDPSPPISPPAPRVLRICADPNNLPFSNRKHEGFEDKIADLLAAELGVALEYEWLPQRLGFYRVALKNTDCNLVMAAPAGFERALTTDAYYRSSYVFVTRRDDGPRIDSFDDPALRSAKVGLWLTGGDNTPPAHALAKRKIFDNVTGYSAFDESEGKPGERLIAAVAEKEIDVAIAWGPSAGYFARELAARKAVPLRIDPVSPETDAIGEASIAFAFDICLGLRRSDEVLRDQINQILAQRREKIAAILADFGVPLVPKPKAGADAAPSGNHERT